MKIILGIDPGLACTGWGIIRKDNTGRLSYMHCGAIVTSEKSAIAERLVKLSEGIRQIVRLHRPGYCAIEETFVNKNPLSSLKLGHARGALLLTLSQEGLAPHEYAATLVKKTVAGAGRAEKGQMQVMVKYLLPGANVTSADAADALAVAICHAAHETWQDKISGASL